MSRLLDAELNDDLFGRLSGQNLEANADKVILISTVDDAGRPHPAMLSYFEVVARDQSNIRLATYKDSKTTANMLRSRKATLSIIDQRVAYYIKGSVNTLETQMRCAPQNAKLNLRIEEVLADEANEEFEPGAYVASGVTYRSLNRREQLAKAKEVIPELLHDGPQAL